MLNKVIIRQRVVGMYSGSRIGVNESMNVYVPYWQDIKTFTSWLLKEIIVEVCKICTIVTCTVLVQKVYGDQNVVIFRPETRLLEWEI